MKIHSDTLTSADVHRACAAAGMRNVYTARLTRHGSRSRDHSFDVTLRGNSTRRPNPGTGSNRLEGEYAATWDEWGMFIQALYLVDPEALIGQYDKHWVFQAATGHRFDTLTADHACPQHGWDSSGMHRMICRRCGATNNYSILIDQMIAQRQAKAATNA